MIVVHKKDRSIKGLSQPQDKMVDKPQVELRHKNGEPVRYTDVNMQYNQSWRPWA